MRGSRGTGAIVYLDHNATVPLRPEAKAAMVAALDACGNPSSIHRFGRGARRLVEDARERIAALVSVPPPSVIFTSGGSEANALALLGCGRRRLLASAVEHASVLAATPRCEQIPVDRDGIIDPDALARALAASTEPAMVSVMVANNETGVLQPLAEVIAAAKRAGALVHTDAVQAAGRLPLSFADLGVDYLSLSAHKLGGPPGVGALIVAEGAPLAPLLRGGGQERGRRAGTENVPGIAGFGAAAAGIDMREGLRLAGLRDALEAGVRRLCPEAVIFGGAVPRLPNTSCLTMPGVSSEHQVIAFDMLGIAVSSGAACSSGKVTASSVLSAMGVPADLARTAIRVSLGWTTCADDVDRFLDAWAAIRQRATAATAIASAA